MFKSLEEQEKEKRKEEWDQKGLLSKGLDYLTRGNQAVVQGVDNVLNGDSFMEGVFDGLKGQADTKSFSELMLNNDILSGDSMGETVGRNVLGLGLDILLDPLTYVTMGAGTGGKLGTLAADIGEQGARKVAANFAKEGVSDVLSKTGDDVLKNVAHWKARKIAAKKMGVALSEVPKEAISREVMGEATRFAANTVSNAILKKSEGAFTAKAIQRQALLTKDKAIRFMGKDIPVLTDLGRAGAGIVGKGYQASKGTPILNIVPTTLEFIGKQADVLFGTGTGLVGQQRELAKVAKSIKADYIHKTNNRVSAVQKTISDIFSGTVREDRVKIMEAIQTGTIDDLDTMITRVVRKPDAAGRIVSVEKKIELKKIARQVESINRRFFEKENALGMVDNALDNYMAGIYREVPLDKKHLIKDLSMNQVGGGFVHNSAKVYQTAKEAAANFLPVVDDAMVVMQARASAHYKTIMNREMLHDVAKTIGTSVDPKEINRIVIEKAYGALKNMERTPAVQKAISSISRMKPNEERGLETIKDIISGVHRRFPQDIQRLIEMTTDDVLEQVAKNSDSAADKFVSSFLPKVKFLDGNALDIAKIQKDNITVYTQKYFVDGVEKKSTHLVPDSIARTFLRSRGNGYHSPETEAFLNIFDRVQNFWKGSMTVMFPAFHARNALTNVMQNFQDIGLRALSPSQHIKASALVGDISNPNLLKKLKGMKINLSDGTTMQLDEVQRLARKYGILTDMPERLELITNKAVREATDKSGNVVSKTYTKALKKGMDVGAYFENQARMLNFVSNLEKYADPMRAAEQAKKFLFDYQNLTRFEKNVMKRVIPFWVWQSKNVALQSEQLIANFGKYTQKAKLVQTAQRIGREMTGLTEEELNEAMPAYMRDSVNIAIGRNENGDPVVINQLGLPEEQYLEYMGSLFSGDVKKWFSKIVGSSTFLVKAPIELGTGKSLFFGEDIGKLDKAYPVFKALPKPLQKAIGFKKVKDKKGREKYIADPYKLYFLQNTFLSRYYTTVGKLMDEDMKGQQVENYINFLSGLKIKPLDPTKQRIFNEYQKKQNALELNRKETMYTEIPQ